MKTLITTTLAGLAMLAATATVQAQRGPDNRPGPGFNSPDARPVVRPVPAPVRPAPPPRRPVVVFTPRPSVPVWTPSLPYGRSYHDVCTRKAWRLRWFERRAAADGYFSPGERAELAALRRDLARTCGGWRWSY